MLTPMVEIQSVTAWHGSRPALDRVSLTVYQGEVFGLLGPNGAGKTTLLACVEGLHRPRQGRVVIDGVEVQRTPQTARRKLGVQLQTTALLDDLTVRELLEVYASLYEVYPTPIQIADLLSQFELTALQHTLGRRLSAGQQQRLALALAVVNDPEVVLLDEPTTALDPHARRAIWDIIRQLNHAGRTVILTTHAMEEAEALCARVALLDQGRVVACDTPAALVAQLKAPASLWVRVDLPLEVMQRLTGVVAARRVGTDWELHTEQPPATLAALQELAWQCGAVVGDVRLRQATLEDVFLTRTGRTFEPQS